MKIVGIDTGVTSKHCAVVVDSETSKSSKPILFGTHTEEFDRMVKEASITGKPEIFAIETAGEAWYALALHLHKLGFKVAIVSPEKSHDFRKSLRKHTKTNRIDAGAIARSIMVDLSSAVFFQPRSSKIEALRHLTRRFTTLQGEQAAHRTAIRAELRTILPSWHQPEGIFTIPYKEWYKRGIDPWYWTEFKQSELLEILQDPTEVKIIMEACKQSRELFSSVGKIGIEPAVFALQQEIAILELFEQQLKVLKKQIVELYWELDPEGILVSLCGVAEFTASVILAEVGDIVKFNNSSGFSAYCGVIPKRNDTGDTHREGQKMTQQGNHHLRRVLFLAALSAIRNDPELANIYYKQKEILKKHHNKAMGFVMNALSRRIYAVLKRNDYLFNPDQKKASGQPYIIRLAGSPIDDSRVAREWIKINRKTTPKKKIGSRVEQYPPEAVSDASRVS